MYGIVASETYGSLKPASATIALVSSGLYWRPRAGSENASEPKLIQRPAPASSRLIRAANTGRSSVTISMSHGVITVSKLPAANGGRKASPSTR